MCPNSLSGMNGVNDVKQARTGIGVAPAIPRRKVGCLGECAVVLPALTGADFRRVTLDHWLCPAIMWCEKKEDCATVVGVCRLSLKTGPFSRGDRNH